jgi:hypothetical protein
MYQGTTSVVLFCQPAGNDGDENKGLRPVFSGMPIITAMYQGTTSVVPMITARVKGFSPCRELVTVRSNAVPKCKESTAGG